MKKRVIPFILGGVLAAVIAANHANGETGNLLGLMSDACFVPGVLLSGVGMIMRIGDAGVFDMLAYGVADMTRAVKGGKQSYYDYKKKRYGKPLCGSGLLLAGGVYLFLAVVFLVVGEV